LKTKRRGRGRGTYSSGRPPIITVYERLSGRVKFVVAKNLSKELIHIIIERHTLGDVVVYTDDFTIYTGISRHDRVVFHGVVRHSDGEYARDDIHINGCEGIHSWVEAFLAIHRGPNRDSLELYLAFYAFWRNHGDRWFFWFIVSCFGDGFWGALAGI